MDVFVDVKERLKVSGSQVSIHQAVHVYIPVAPLLVCCHPCGCMEVLLVYIEYRYIKLKQKHSILYLKDITFRYKVLSLIVDPRRQLEVNLSSCI
jgi:hypothetical protein